MRYTMGLAAALTMVPLAAADAHVTLETNQAVVGSAYKAVLRVPHGCDGAATVALRVRIPPGVLEVKPMPKAGWDLKAVTGPYAKPQKLRNATITTGVTEIDWSGGKLPDAFYDEFVFIAYLGADLAAGDTIYFPVVQECETGVHRWIDIPAPGAKAAEPAPGLKLLPAR